MKDTSKAVAEAQIAVYRNLAGAARLRLAFEMSDLARALAAARLRLEHPRWTAGRLNRELLRQSLLPAALPAPLE
jgi:hypothetical protein